jgi:hypothetical protein
MNKSIFAALAVGLSLSACSVREGRIAVPSGVAIGSERLELRGMGGGERGHYQLGDAVGSFSRRADRLGLLDPLLVRHRGGGSFHLEQMGEIPALGGRCSFRQNQVSVGPISLTPRRLAFQCDFARDDRGINASLYLEDPQSAFGTLHGRAEREGILHYEDVRIAIRSIHQDERGGLPNPAPLGYVFIFEGREIGAVDLNGLNKTIYAPRPAALREAVIAASLALVVFWDPAVVQADD